MRPMRNLWPALLAFVAVGMVANLPAAAQQQQKPTPFLTRGDDMGGRQRSIYHQGWRVGKPPTIDRIGKEGANSPAYSAEQSCTAGRNAFSPGLPPLRPGMIPPQLPG